MERQTSEGYRQSVVTILHAYIEKRITFKNTLGTISGNLKQIEVQENRRSRSPGYVQMVANKIENEEIIVRTIVQQAYLQTELLT